MRSVQYYKNLWDTCEISSTHEEDVRRVVNRIYSHATIYLKVCRATGVPWALIAALHYREADLDFDLGLHNGEPWYRKTRGTPKGRGPFLSWDDAAVDALNYEGLAYHPDSYWSIGKQLQAAERYNGWGYAMRDKNSPYVWSWTNHGIGTGYFTSDGHYSPTAVNRQAGVAAILKTII